MTGYCHGNNYIRKSQCCRMGNKIHISARLQQHSAHIWCLQFSNTVIFLKLCLWVFFFIYVNLSHFNLRTKTSLIQIKIVHCFVLFLPIKDWLINERWVGTYNVYVLSNTHHCLFYLVVNGHGTWTTTKTEK